MVDPNGKYRLFPKIENVTSPNTRSLPVNLVRYRRKTGCTIESNTTTSKIVNNHFNINYLGLDLDQSRSYAITLTVI